MGNAEYMGKLNLKLEKIIKMKLAATLVVVASAGKVKDPVKRLNKLRGHAETLLDLADNNTTTNDNNIARANKWVSKMGTRPQRSTPPSHAQLRKKPMKPSSSTRKTSASSTVRSPPLSDPSSENTAAKARSQEELPQHLRQANPPNAKHLCPNCRLLSIQIIQHFSLLSTA